MTPSLAAAPQRRAYDHRLREQVCRTGSHALSRRLEIPRSTIATWKRRGLRPVVSVEMFEADRPQLLRTIVAVVGIEHHVLDGGEPATSTDTITLTS